MREAGGSVGTASRHPLRKAERIDSEMLVNAQAAERRHQDVLQQERAHHQAQLAKARAAQVPPASCFLQPFLQPSHSRCMSGSWASWPAAVPSGASQPSPRVCPGGGAGPAAGAGGLVSTWFQDSILTLARPANSLTLRGNTWGTPEVTLKLLHQSKHT